MGYTQKENAPPGGIFTFLKGGIFTLRYPAHLAATGIAPGYFLQYSIVR